MAILTVLSSRVALALTLTLTLTLTRLLEAHRLPAHLEVAVHAVEGAVVERRPRDTEGALRDGAEDAA